MKAFTLRNPLLLLLLQAISISETEASICDEAKCRGTKIHPWVDNDLELTCWIPLSQVANVTDAKYCANGYVGHVIEDVPHEIVDDEERAWYTCCPPDFEGEAVQTCTYSDCSSPDWANGGNCWADGFQEPMSCGSSKYRYPHFTSQKSLIYYQYLCCDSPPGYDSVTQELLYARAIWMTLSCITIVACSIFLAAILSSKTARSEGWNIYLVFLAIPDTLYNVLIVLRNALTIPGIPVSPTVHVFFASVEYWYAAANLWLNMVVIYQVYYVLRNSSPSKRAPTPTVGLAVKQSMVVYAVAFVVFWWAFYLYKRALVDMSLDATVNSWISTRAIMVIPPLVYVIWVCFDVWYRQLLPRSGRTRVLSLYFLRVIVVFLFTWIPYFILYEYAWNISYSMWTIRFSYYLGSIQGAISVAVALSKPDVKEAVLRLLCCRFGDDNVDKNKPVTKRMDTNDTTDSCPCPSTTEQVNEWYQDDFWGGDDMAAFEAAMNGTDEESPEQAVQIPEPAVPDKGTDSEGQ